jgi:hypothetical protein
MFQQSARWIQRFIDGLSIPAASYWIDNPGGQTFVASTTPAVWYSGSLPFTPVANALYAYRWGAVTFQDESYSFNVTSNFDFGGAGSMSRQSLSYAYAANTRQVSSTFYFGWSTEEGVGAWRFWRASAVGSAVAVVAPITTLPTVTHSVVSGGDNVAIGGQFYASSWSRL